MTKPTKGQTVPTEIQIVAKWFKKPLPQTDREERQLVKTVAAALKLSPPQNLEQRNFVLKRALEIGPSIVKEERKKFQLPGVPGVPTIRQLELLGFSPEEIREILDRDLAAGITAGTKEDKDLPVDKLCEAHGGKAKDGDCILCEIEAKMGNPFDTKEEYRRQGPSELGGEAPTRRQLELLGFSPEEIDEILERDIVDTEASMYKEEEKKLLTPEERQETVQRMRTRENRTMEGIKELIGFYGKLPRFQEGKFSAEALQAILRDRETTPTERQLLVGEIEEALKQPKEDSAEYLERTLRGFDRFSVYGGKGEWYIIDNEKEETVAGPFDTKSHAKDKKLQMLQEQWWYGLQDPKVPQWPMRGSNLAGERKFPLNPYEVIEEEGKYYVARNNQKVDGPFDRKQDAVAAAEEAFAELNPRMAAMEAARERRREFGGRRAVGERFEDYLSRRKLTRKPSIEKPYTKRELQQIIERQEKWIESGDEQWMKLSDEQKRQAIEGLKQLREIEEQIPEEGKISQDEWGKFLESWGPEGPEIKPTDEELIPDEELPIPTTEQYIEAVEGRGLPKGYARHFATYLEDLAVRDFSEESINTHLKNFEMERSMGRMEGRRTLSTRGRKSDKLEVKSERDELINDLIDVGFTKSELLPLSDELLIKKYWQEFKEELNFLERIKKK